MNVARRADGSVLLGATWLAGLMAVHPLPHTGALRSLLILIALVHVGMLYWRRPAHRRPALPPPGVEGALLALLTGWLVFQAAVLAPAATSALAELGREWAKLLGMAGLGIGLAAFARTGNQAERNAARLATGMFLGLFAHVPLTLGYHAWRLWQTGQLPLGESPLGNYGYVSLLVNAALAFQLADVARRLCQGGRLLPWSNSGAALAIAATLAANALLTSKAGLIMTHLLAWTFLAAVLRHGTPHRRTAMLAVLAVVFGLGLATLASVMAENRWTGAMGSIASGVATAEVPAAPASSPTPTPPIPSLHSPIQRIDGNDPSFYFRSSWASMGLQGIARHPLGIGYGSDAFGRYLAAQYGVTGFVSSHNGWIDFTLANGVPALLLLLALAGALMWRGWLAFRTGNAAGLALSLATLNYVGRCAMDGYLTGSRLTGFAIMTGVLWGLSVLPRTSHGSGPA
jgi:hypothetical protein